MGQLRQEEEAKKQGGEKKADRLAVKREKSLTMGSCELFLVNLFVTFINPPTPGVVVGVPPLR